MSHFRNATGSGTQRLRTTTNKTLSTHVSKCPNIQDVKHCQIIAGCLTLRKQVCSRWSEIHKSCFWNVKVGPRQAKPTQIDKCPNNQDVKHCQSTHVDKCLYVNCECCNICLQKMLRLKTTKQQSASHSQIKGFD